jgi:hypothetical protein
VKVVGLSKNKFVAFFQKMAAKQMTSSMAKAGQAIQDKGTTGQQKAWADAKSVTVHVSENGSSPNEAGSRSLGNDGTVGSNIDIWKPGVSGSSDVQAVTGAHEILHGDAKFNDLNKAVGADPKDAADRANLESQVQSDALGVLRDAGAVPPASEEKFCNQYLCEK